MIKKTFPKLRLIVSFADPSQGHHGGIYQGGGWVYGGRTTASDEYIFRGKRWQGRSFRNKYTGMEKHPSVKIIKGSSKYRYLFPLDFDIQRKIEPLRKPYPKRAVSKENVACANHAQEGGVNPTTALQEMLNS